MHAHIFKAGNGNNQWNKPHPTKGKGVRGGPDTNKGTSRMISEADHQKLVAAGYQHVATKDSHADGMSAKDLGNMLITHKTVEGVYQHGKTEALLTHADIRALTSKVKKTDAPGVQRQAQVAQAFTSN
jgi:hypothetical protein